MSDSLRDQLKQAGFTETKPKPRNNKKSNSKHSRNHSSNTAGKAHKAKQAQADKASEIAARKVKKNAITELINEHHIKKFAGESAYSYTLDKKIRQLFVTDEARVKLISGEWVITRLNGTTHLIPQPTGDAILAINPQWLIVSSQNDGDNDDDYNEHPVPDDLQW